MTDLAITDEFGVGWVPYFIMGVGRVAFFAVPGKIGSRAYMVGVVVRLDLSSIPEVPHEIAELIIMVESGWMACFGRIHGIGRPCRDPLIPVAILANKRGWVYDLRRELLKASKFTNRGDQTGIVTGDAIFRVVPSRRFMVPPVDPPGGARPTVATGRAPVYDAVPVYQHAGRVGNDVMTGLAKPVSGHDVAVVMPPRQTRAVTLATLGFGEILITGIVHPDLLRHIIHIRVGSVVIAIQGAQDFRCSGKQKPDEGQA